MRIYKQGGKCGKKNERGDCRGNLKGEAVMDVDEIFRRADFSRETDYKMRLWRKLALKTTFAIEGELDDDVLWEVAAARANPQKIMNCFERRKNYG